MSEEEESDVGSSEDESEKSDEEEEEGDEEIEENDEKAEKAAKVIEDIELLEGIFQFLDHAAKRITSRQQLQEQFDALTISNKQLEAKINHLEKCIDQQQVEIARLARDEDSESEYQTRSFSQEAVSWSQYEGMNEEQRAQLLEKAIEVLGREDAVPLKGSHRRRKK